MGMIKARRVAGYDRVTQDVEFTGSVLASGLNCTPWANLFYVNGITDEGHDNNDGKAPGSSKASIQGAVDDMVGGDIAIINPLTFHEDRGFNRYTEDVVITSGIASNVFANANMKLIGVAGPGSNGDFLGVRWTHETATALTNYAPALQVENIGFFSEGGTYGVHLVHDGAANTKQGSQGTSFYKCAFKGKGLYVLSGGDGLTVDTCRFQCAYNGVVAQLNYSASANPGRRLTVRNSEWLDGNGNVSSDACIHIAAPCTEILIRDCYFPQIPTGNEYITATGACEGLIANVHCAAADLVLATAFNVASTLITAGIYDKIGLVVA